MGDDMVDLQRQVAEALEYHKHEAKVSVSHQSEREFVEVFRQNFDGLFICQTPEEAVQWALETTSDLEILDMLNDGEDTAKEYLDRRGYEVFADTESASEAMADNVISSIGGSSAIHQGYISDVRDELSKAVNKHGWLKVLFKLTELR